MDFGFAEGGADAENGAFAVRADAQGDEDGTVKNTTALADFFIAGIQQDIGIKGQRPSAPGFQFGVQLRGATADLGGTDTGPTELFDNRRDFAGGDTLDIHF